jgi:hypothetical protein
MKMSEALERAIAMDITQTNHELFRKGTDRIDGKDCACGIGAIAIGACGSFTEARNKWRSEGDSALGHTKAYANFLTSIGVDCNVGIVNEVVCYNDIHYEKFSGILAMLKEKGY